MATTPAELLKSAKAIDRSSEAGCRAAISRAYYSAYHAALPFVELLPSSPDYKLSGYLRHSEAAERIRAWKIPQAWADASRKAGDPAVVQRQYRAALAKRKLADYRMNNVVREQEVVDQINDASDILIFFVRLGMEIGAQAA